MLSDFSGSHYFRILSGQKKSCPAGQLFKGSMSICVPLGCLWHGWTYYIQSSMCFSDLNKNHDASQCIWKTFITWLINTLKTGRFLALELWASRLGMAERMGLLVNSTPDRSLIASYKTYGPLLFTSRSGARPASEQFPRPAFFGYLPPAPILSGTPKSIMGNILLLAMRLINPHIST